MKRHLLSAADLDRDDALLVLDTAAEMRAAHRPGGQEAADAARPHRGQPLLRGLHPHPHLVRGRRQAALGRRHQLLRQGLERLQGREPQGHRAHPRGDGRRRRRHPARRRAAPRTGSRTRAGSGARSSTPATAPTSTPPRRCSTRSRCAATSPAARATSRAAASRSSATSCTAGWRAATSCCSRTLGAEVTLVAPPTLLPVGVETWPCATSYDLDAAPQGRRRRDDAARPARADERRVLPERARVQPPLRPRRAGAWRSCPTTRSSCTPAR